MPSAQTASPPVSSEQELGRWLSKDQAENPFLVDGFDCLSFTQSMRSVTKDQQVATSFVALRQSVGAEYQGRLPENSVEIDCDLEYPYSSEITDGAVFKAATMEQKWDIYLYGDRIYFCRSWTGSLAYVAAFIKKNDAIGIVRIWSIGEQVNDARLVIRQVDYLVKSHLFRRRVPHPLPSDFPKDPHKIAFYSFSQYGNMCCFGTFDDTLAWDIVKPRNPAT